MSWATIVFSSAVNLVVKRINSFQTVVAWVGRSLYFAEITYGKTFIPTIQLAIGLREEITRTNPDATRRAMDSSRITWKSAWFDLDWSHVLTSFPHHLYSSVRTKKLHNINLKLPLKTWKKCPQIGLNSQSIVYCSIGDTSLCNFYIMTLSRAMFNLDYRVQKVKLWDLTHPV